MNSKMIKSALAAALAAIMATGGAAAQMTRPVDSAGNTVDPSGKHADGSQINPVEERQNRLFGRDDSRPLPGVMNESNQVSPGVTGPNVVPPPNPHPGAPVVNTPVR